MTCPYCEGSIVDPCHHCRDSQAQPRQWQPTEQDYCEQCDRYNWEGSLPTDACQINKAACRLIPVGKLVI